jgi:hypothetical protein
MPEIESDAVRQWREKFEEAIKAKDEKSQEKHQKILEKAKKDLQGFYAEYQAKKDALMESNLNEQEAFIKERDEDPVGKRWEQIHRLIENASKPKNCRDTSRMKSLFASLKHDAKAPGNK